MMIDILHHLPQISTGSLRKSAELLLTSAGIGLAGPALAQSCVADPAATAARPPGPDMLTGTLPPDLVARLDAAAEAAFAEAAAPGIVVGVRTPDGTWTAAYGLADPVENLPMTVGLHTRVGSLTKTYTGTLLMQLVEAGALTLDDTIDNWVPGIPNGDAITLRMLAEMISGVGSYTRSRIFTDRYFGDPDTIFTPAELVAVAIAESPRFDPGTEYDYSNSNTVLLGLVIEQETRQPIGRVLEERIFDPLGLDNTSWPGDSPAMPVPFAEGFTLQGETATPEAPSNATFWNPSFGWTAGEIIADMGDLLAYGRALGTGQGVLKPETQVLRLQSVPGPGGYGIAFGCADGWMGHTGELPGYNSTLFYQTAADITVAVQANSDIATGACDPDTPVLPGNRTDIVCSSPATRVFVALADALGHPFTPPPRN